MQTIHHLLLKVTNDPALTAGLTPKVIVGNEGQRAAALSRMTKKAAYQREETRFRCVLTPTPFFRVSNYPAR
jgi:hypothetical protein